MKVFFSHCRSQALRSHLRCTLGWVSGRVQTRGVIYRESTLLCRAPSVTHCTLLGKPQRTWWFIYIKQPERSLQVLHGDGIVRLEPGRTRPHQQKCLLDSGRGASKYNSDFASLYKLWQVPSAVLPAAEQHSWRTHRRWESWISKITHHTPASRGLIWLNYNAKHLEPGIFKGPRRVLN